MRIKFFLMAMLFALPMYAQSNDSTRIVFIRKGYFHGLYLYTFGIFKNDSVKIGKSPIYSAFIYDTDKQPAKYAMRHNIRCRKSLTCGS